MAGYNLIPNMEQMNPEYANSTQYTKTGGKTYAVTYGPNGEYQARTLVPDYDYNLGVDRAGLQAVEQRGDYKRHLPHTFPLSCEHQMADPKSWGQPSDVLI